MQTNRINGNNLIDTVEGNHPSLSLIPLDMHPASPNQRLEAGVVQFGYYGLIAPDPNKFLISVQFLIQFLLSQLSTGHMGIEVLTDSHEAIWLRAMMGLRLFQIRMSKEVHPTTPEFNTLASLALQWFNHHASLLSLGYIPTGPLAGCILLPCARKRGASRAEKEKGSILSGVGRVGHGGAHGGVGGGVHGIGRKGPGAVFGKPSRKPGKGDKGAQRIQGEAEGGPDASESGSDGQETPSIALSTALVDHSELTRDVWYGQLLSQGRAARSAGANFWTLSKESQDTASGPIYRLAVKEGGEWVIPYATLPKLISPLEVTRYTNGHVAKFIDNPSLEDGVTYCKVEWSTGRFTFIEGEGEDGMELWREVSREITG